MKPNTITTTAPAARLRKRRGENSLWLVAVAAAYSLAELLFVSPRLGLGWDETIYVSQVARHVPPSFFSAPRARGISVLVAPVASVTDSTSALRVYLSIMSGLGLLAALFAWRRLRPAWLLAMAGALFGGLWVSQFYGPQAMPNLWVAFSGLAAAGCFVRLSRGAEPAAAPAAQPGAGGWRVADTGPAGTPPAAEARPAQAAHPNHRAGPLAGLVASLAAAALVRPSDAIWLALPMVAVALIRRRPRWPVLAAVVGGLLAGSAEWITEAYVRFGGLAARIHESSQAEGNFGLHFALPAELRALNGPTLCKPCTVAWKYPELSVWWLALPVLATLGVIVTHRASRSESSLVPALCGLSAAVPYLFLINYAAPRFLLPSYALLSIPVADGLAWLISRAGAELRPVVITLAALGIAAQLGTQHLVLDRTVGRTMVDHTEYARLVAGLRTIGVRPPCLLTGEQAIPIAYYARCSSAQTSGTDKATSPAGIRRAALSEHTAVLVIRGHAPPPYARGWPLHLLPGTRVLKLAAYRAPW